MIRFAKGFLLETDEFFSVQGSPYPVLGSLKNLGGDH
jgi:hypothetical protein